MADGVELGVAYVTLAVSGEKVAPGVRKALGDAGPEADRAGKQAGKSYSSSFGSVLKGTLGAIGIAELGRTAIGFAKDSFAEAREAQKVGAQTEAVIKSTGKAAGISAGQIGTLSTAISNKVGIDDEAIQSGANLLLTFTNVRNEAGKGNDVFSQTVQLATDMSVALGTDAKGGALQLGKALNDPAKGYSRLQRSGVSFTESQIKQIKALQKSGDLLGAQKVILREVAKEFGGSAEAQATAGDKARVAYQNLQEQIGTALLPVLNKTSQAIANDIVPAVSEFVSGMQDGTGAGGQFAHTLGDIYDFGKGVVTVIDGLPGPVKKFAIEAGIAYLVLSKFGPGLSSAGASTRTFVSGLANAETRLATVGKASYALGGALRQAGGVGGMLLLANSTKQTSSELGALQGAAGGALLGFELGGPIGSAIGAGVGGILGLVSATKRSKNQFKLSSSEAQNYAATLDQVTGAATKATRAEILGDLAKNKTLQSGLNAGLTQRTLIDAALGKPAAINAVREAVRGLNAEVAQTKTAEAGKGGAAAFGKVQKAAKGAQEDTRALNSLIGQQANQYAKTSRATRLAYYATADQKKLLQSFPKAAVTEIKAKGAKDAYGEIGQLIRRYKLTPKEIQTVAGLAGVDVSLKFARELDAQYSRTAKPRKTKFNADTKAAAAAAAALSRALDKAARERTANIKLTYSGTQNKPKVSTSGGGGQTGGRFASPAPALVGAPSGRSALTITNWADGTGYIETIADDRYYSNQAYG